MTTFDRRHLLLGGLGLAATASVAACTSTTVSHTGMDMSGSTFGTPTPISPSPGQQVVERTLRAAATKLDLGGVEVDTWAYDGVTPGPILRATAGDFLRITLDNELPADTTVHWHGIRLRNAADGVPGLTQNPVASGGKFVYEFTVPDPGTYFFHPHVGLQLDRGLYAPLIIDDPAEPGAYDAEWVVVLDDWLDGIDGRTPDDVLAGLIDAGGGSGSSMGGMGGMDHSMGMGASPWGDAGDVTYPHFLINGKVPTTPETFEAQPGQRIRIRLINAASDTIFAVALNAHRMSITHTDGFAVEPTEVGALYLGMGERYDVIVTAGDGVFPLVAKPFGKTSGGQAMALLRTGAAAAPPPDVVLPELAGEVFVGSQLQPVAASALANRPVDAVQEVMLQGAMKPYAWGINGGMYGQNAPLTVKAGQRLQLNATNMTMMTHPLHVHGHTFALPSGLRKDTVLLAPMQSMPVVLDADNEGDWMVHCHNAYHGEAGMMIALKYT